jgi:hypothetical protein
LPVIIEKGDFYHAVFLLVRNTLEQPAATGEYGDHEEYGEYERHQEAANLLRRSPGVLNELPLAVDLLDLVIGGRLDALGDFWRHTVRHHCQGQYVAEPLAKIQRGKQSTLMAVPVHATGFYVVPGNMEQLAYLICGQGVYASLDIFEWHEPRRVSHRLKHT